MQSEDEKTGMHIEVQFVPAADPEELEQQQKQTRIEDWVIKSFDEHKLDLKVTYENPIAVSQNDQPDRIIVKLYLSDIKDEYG